MNQIMVLATFHMQAQHDVHNFTQSDMIREHEGEIVQIVDSISKFKPTKIAVEYPKKRQLEVDEAYAKYSAFGSDSTNEIIQIGFRLAKKLGLTKVDAIDWMENGAVERGCGDVLDYLYSNQPELAKEIDSYECSVVDLEKETLWDAFLRLNSEKSVRDSLAYYMNYARIGSEEYYGNGWLIWWYQRNLNIFSNVSALTEGANDERVLLLIGGAHKGILEQFFRNSLAFDVVDVNSFLC